MKLIFWTSIYCNILIAFNNHNIVRLRKWCNAALIKVTCVCSLESLEIDLGSHLGYLTWHRPEKLGKLKVLTPLAEWMQLNFVSHSGYAAVLKFITLIVLVFLFGLKTVFIYWSLVTHICGSEPGHHDDVIKSIHFPRYWPFVRSPVNFPHKG